MTPSSLTGKGVRGKGDKKEKSADLIDAIGAGDATKDENHNDSFEKYYNKDLDLDEGKRTLSISRVLSEQL